MLEKNYSYKNVWKIPDSIFAPFGYASFELLVTQDCVELDLGTFQALIEDEAFQMLIDTSLLM